MDEITHTFSQLSLNLFAVLRERGRNNADMRPLTVSVTSAQPREGKTLIAQGLALHAAALGEFRILLVDANFDAPMLASRFAGGGKIGLSDVLQNGATAAAELLATPLENMFVIGAGRVPRPALLYREEALQKFTDSASVRAFDVLIFDNSCVSPNRTNLVAQKSDRVLFVVDATATRRETVQYALGRLKDGVRDPLWGIVLNKKPKYALSSE
jgi:Mrp family chromosome partitioning ATPase